MSDDKAQIIVENAIGGGILGAVIRGVAKVVQGGSVEEVVEAVIKGAVMGAAGGAAKGAVDANWPSEDQPEKQ